MLEQPLSTEWVHHEVRWTSKTVNNWTFILQRHFLVAYLVQHVHNKSYALAESLRTLQIFYSKLQLVKWAMEWSFSPCVRWQSTLRSVCTIPLPTKIIVGSLGSSCCPERYCFVVSRQPVLSYCGIYFVPGSANFADWDKFAGKMLRSRVAFKGKIIMTACKLSVSLSWCHVNEALSSSFLYFQLLHETSMEPDVHTYVHSLYEEKTILPPWWCQAHQKCRAPDAYAQVVKFVKS